MKTRLFNISYRLPDVTGGWQAEQFHDVANEDNFSQKKSEILEQQPKATLYIYEIELPTVPLI